MSERGFAFSKVGGEPGSSGVATAGGIGNAGEASFPGGIAPVPQPHTDTKTDGRSKRSAAPEKTTDAGKSRSVSGDILDLSGVSTTKNVDTGSANEMETGRETRTVSDSSGKNGNDAAPTGSTSRELTEEEQQQVQELKNRDAEVRTHEAAHLAAAGPYARGGAQYEYQTGPDGKKYAIGGSVSIDSGPVKGDPEATIEKARIVRAAALAPASPSSQDQKVAAAASRMEADARLQLSRQKHENRSEGSRGSEVSSRDLNESGKGKEMFSSPSDHSDGAAEDTSGAALIERLIADARAEKEEDESVAKPEKSISATSGLVSFSSLNGSDAVSAYRQQRLSTSPRFIAYG